MAQKKIKLRPEVYENNSVRINLPFPPFEPNFIAPLSQSHPCVVAIELNDPETIVLRYIFICLSN